MIVHDGTLSQRSLMLRRDRPLKRLTLRAPGNGSSADGSASAPLVDCRSTRMACCKAETAVPSRRLRCPEEDILRWRLSMARVELSLAVSIMELLKTASSGTAHSDPSPSSF
jgi:hypothetical protein